jgi:hypothetical protein
VGGEGRLLLQIIGLFALATGFVSTT